jgi:hypothetical protein
MTASMATTCQEGEPDRPVEDVPDRLVRLADVGLLQDDDRDDEQRCKQDRQLERRAIRSLRSSMRPGSTGAGYRLRAIT